MPPPYPPFDPSSGVRGFDVHALTRELTALPAYQQSGKVSRTLARSEQMTTILIVLKKNAELHDHSAPGPVTATTLSGCVTFTFNADGEAVHLPAGNSVVFAKDAPHRVTAIDDSVLLLVIGAKKGT